MRYRSIGDTGVNVSEVGFGVWTIAAGWWGEYSDADAVRLLQDAQARGITFFDSAETYGNGRGESLLARAFPGASRANVVIATKFGYDWQNRPAEQQAGHQEAPQRWDPDFLEEALDGSLRRLETDYVDLWQFHNPRMDALERDDVWTFLERVKASGKVRSVGVALGPAIGWEDEGVYVLNERPVDAVQIIYNALELDPGRRFLEEAKRNRRSLLVRVPHSSGLLEGHYTEETTFGENDHRRHRPRTWLTNGLKKIEQLEFLTEEGQSLGQAALRYVLKEADVASALPNIYDLDQINDFVGASACPDVSDDQAARVEALYEENYGLPLEQEQGLAPAEGRSGTRAASGGAGA